MDANDRQNEILSLLTQQDRVEVEDLARRFGVSLQTVRTDLRDLSARGQLSRVHGGAVRISSAANRGYAERRSLNASGKRAMAALASDIQLSIHPHPTLSETVMEAAEVHYGQSPHLYSPKRG